MKTNNEKQTKSKFKSPFVIGFLSVVIPVIIISLFLNNNEQKNGEPIADVRSSFNGSDLNLLNDEYISKPVDYSKLDEYSVATIVFRSNNSDYEDISFIVKQQSEDEDLSRGADYFLNHNEDGSEGYPGQIFTESDTTQDFLGFNQFNTVIYGHNMKDGTGFGWIRKFIDDESMLNAYDYAYIYYTSGCVARYKLACISTVSDENLTTYFNGFKTGKDSSDFVQYMYDNATNVKVDESEDLLSSNRHITLSTCLGDDTKRRALLLEYDGSVFVDSVEK